jgi:glycosyltransferase involved in cell wall biosynthesis
MEHCIETLLFGGERVEILIVNDGSKDGTAAIADKYAAKYPTIVKAIHQENGGHGEAVNAGLRNATGKFFKVVDSDDWVDEGAYRGILDVLEVYQDQIELMISNYVYEKQGAKHKKVMEYTKYLPVNRVFTWNDIKPFPIGKYLLMHSVIYKTQVLRDCGLELPKHTFYVDNIFVFEPLPNIKHMYYLNVDFYRYFIGRDDQSVNEKVMIGRLEQQMRVNRIMAKSYSKMEIADEYLKKYMFNYLSIITTVSSILAIKSGTAEHLAMKDQLWADLKVIDKKLYRKLRWTVLGMGVNLPGKFGQKLAVLVYKAAQKIYGFN